jgi:hypothetical protein
MSNTDYKALKVRIEQWLTEHGVKWTIGLIGDACPPFCEDKNKPEIGTFPRKSHIHGQNYRLILERASGKWAHGPFAHKNFISVEYWNSYRDASVKHVANVGPAKIDEHKLIAILKQAGFSKRIVDSVWNYSFFVSKEIREYLKENTITVSDVLGCVDFYVAETFEEFCQEFGYDSDSRRAEAIYQTIQSQVADFKRMFTPEELSELSELKGEL